MYLDATETMSAIDPVLYSSFIMMALASFAGPGTGESIIGPICQLLSALAWPATMLILLLTQRKPLARMLSSLTTLAESANKIKIWQFEVERTIDKEVDNAAKAASIETPDERGIGRKDVLAAARVETLASKLPTIHKTGDVANSVRQRMLELALKYDSTRSQMEAGRPRTQILNEITAQMRALGLACRRWLEEFSQNKDSAGIRLCAVAILQMAPDDRYIKWLGARYRSEAPFIFFQSSVALMEAAKRFSTTKRSELLETIDEAIQQIRSFRDGEPDRNSLIVLEAAKARLFSAEK